MYKYSFDDIEDKGLELLIHFSPEASDTFKNLVKDAYPYISKYVNLLPVTDKKIAKLYYLHGLKQSQIGELLGVTQVAICKRLNYIVTRLKFLLKTPLSNPMEVRETLKKLFGDEHFESAYYFYFEHSQNRVKFFLETSQSGAANRFHKFIEKLDSIISRLEGKDNLTDEEVDLLFSAITYKEYYMFIKENSSIQSFLFKKNDVSRISKITYGDFIYK